MQRINKAEWDRLGGLRNPRLGRRQQPGRRWVYLADIGAEEGARMKQNPANMTAAEREENLICACAVCREDMYKGDILADHWVEKYGELQYIELAHLECAQRVDPDNSYWLYD